MQVFILEPFIRAITVIMDCNCHHTTYAGFIKVIILNSTIDFIGTIYDMDKILRLLSIGMNVCWSSLFYRNNMYNHSTTIGIGREPALDISSALREQSTSPENNSSQTMTNDESYRDMNNIRNYGCGILLSIEANYVLKQLFKLSLFLAIIICMIQRVLI